MSKKEQLLENFKTLKKETTYNYEYSYFRKNDQGDLIIDKDLNSLYGKNRNGYEKLKENNSCKVEYSGVVSIRKAEFTDTKIEDIYISETKLSYETYSDRLMQLEKDAKEYAIGSLIVNDIEAFEYFLNDRLEWDFNIKPEHCFNNIRFYIQLVEDFQNDEEFKRYMNKIIK